MIPRARPLDLAVTVERFPLRSPFRISGREFRTADVVVVELRSSAHKGRGEASGVFYRGETAERIAAEIETCRPHIERGADRNALRSLLPAGGARNALDCALWDLEAKRAGATVWQLAGLKQPMPLRTTFTIGVAAPEAMANAAGALREAQAIKLKLSGDWSLDLERVAAVREARPDAWLGVDGNQGFDEAGLEDLLPGLIAARVSLLEQPLPRGADQALKGFESPIPVAADESIETLSDLPAATALYDVINIKLDKCGGLTEGLLIAAEVKRLGRRAMVGSMPCTSLAIAPAFCLAQSCDIVDLDAPFYLAHDRDPGATLLGSRIWVGDEVWGGGANAG